jgi:hypothetical protein
MLVRLLELSWWFYIHEKKQLHEVIYMTSETPNRHIRCILDIVDGCGLGRLVIIQIVKLMDLRTYELL